MIAEKTCLSYTSEMLNLNSMPTEIPFPKALELTLASALDLGEETIPIRKALQRVLSRTMLSPVSIPPTRNSAMDGYALPDDGSHSAGFYHLLVRPEEYQPGANVFCRVLTGQAVPEWAFCVAAEEHCHFENTHLITPSGFPRHSNIRPLGEDTRAGSPVLETGTRLDAAALARLASAGFTRVFVRRLPRILILTSGNELTRPGPTHFGIGLKKPGQKFECDSTLVRSLLAQEGLTARILPHLPDRRDRFIQALLSLKPFDFLISCGGAANSEADHIRPALRQVGAEFLYERVRIKPARPTALARLKNGLVFCLPGNPVAVFAGFHALVLPALRASLGISNPGQPRFYAHLGEDFRSDARRHLLARVHLEFRPEGITAFPHPESGSALLRSLTESQGLAVIEPGATIPGGTPIPLLWARLPG